MTLHKEATGTLIVTTLFIALVNYLFFYFFPDNSVVRNLIILLSIGFFLIVLQFFRKPTRTTVQNPKHIIAPADGKVVVIEETIENEYFKEPRIQVSIFMSPLNVHMNFNPISGIVSFFKYHKGKYLVAWHPKSSTDNERTTVVVKNDNGIEVLYRQIAGALARRICWYLKEGDKVEQGDEFGFIKFGSRVDVFLPIGTKILCQLDDKPVGGETVIAELV